MAQLVDFNPHVVIHAGVSSDFVDNALPLVEQLLTVGPRPEWLFGDAYPSLVSYASMPNLPDPDFGDRARTLSLLDADNTLFDAFKVAYAADCPDFAPPQVSALAPDVGHTYDAVFLLALAHLAGGNHMLPTAQLTGKMLATGLKALAPAGHASPATAMAFDLSPAGLSALSDTLVAGREVDVRGVSGSIDWDLSTRTPALTLQVWCVGEASPGMLDWVYAGQSYDPGASVLTGGYACP